MLALPVKIPQQEHILTRCEKCLTVNPSGPLEAAHYSSHTCLLEQPHSMGMSFGLAIENRGHRSQCLCDTWSYLPCSISFNGLGSPTQMNEAQELHMQSNRSTDPLFLENTQTTCLFQGPMSFLHHAIYCGSCALGSHVST